MEDSTVSVEVPPVTSPEAGAAAAAKASAIDAGVSPPAPAVDGAMPPPLPEETLEGKDLLEALKKQVRCCSPAFFIF